MDVSTDVLKLLDLLRPLCCKDPEVVSSFLKEKLPGFDLSRDSITEAIGWNDTHAMNILKENRKLSVKYITLIGMAHILATLEIRNSSGTILALHMKEGMGIVDSENNMYNLFDFSERDVTIVAKDLCKNDAITLSRNQMRLIAPEIAAPDQVDDTITRIQLQYVNGVVINANFESSVDIEGFPQSDTRVSLEEIIVPFSVVLPIMMGVGFGYRKCEEDEN